MDLAERVGKALCELRLLPLTHTEVDITIGECDARTEMRIVLRVELRRRAVNILLLHPAKAVQLASHDSRHRSAIVGAGIGEGQIDPSVAGVVSMRLYIQQATLHAVPHLRQSLHATNLFS